MVNVESVKKVSDLLKNLPTSGSFAETGFSMGEWNGSVGDRYYIEDTSMKSCGTVACIGGWTCILISLNEVEDDKSVLYNEYKASKFLGINDSQAYNLFYPEFLRDDDAVNKVTPVIAAQVLDHLAETGEVDWDRVLRMNDIKCEDAVD